MKKFCSICGNQLELSQPLCSECKAVNPFFVPAFSILSDQSESLEKLRLEKERIEKELQAKEKAQKEFERQEKLQHEIEELERLKAERIEAERILREQVEQERQAELQRELERQKKARLEIEELEREKLRHIEAEKAMREKAEKERQEAEALERQKAEKLELEKAIREKADREQIEKTREKLQRQAQLRKEIEALEEQKNACIEKALTISKLDVTGADANEEPVTKNTDKNQDEKLRLLLEAKQEVREELQRIEEENKRLKQELETLTKQIAEKDELLAAQIATEQPAPVTPPAEEAKPSKQKQNNLALKAVLGIALLLAGFLIYFYFTNIKDTSIASLPPQQKEETSVVTPITTSPEKIIDTVLADETNTDNAIDSVETEPVKITPAILAASSVKAQPVAEKPAAEKIIVNETKVRGDLTGKKISGCGFTIGSDVELKSVSNLIRVERSDNYTKYKCVIKMTEGNDTYTAVPYLYYADDGTLLKIDGSNCE